MSTSEETDVGRTMRRAIAEVRREGIKAAALYAVVDAAFVAVAVNLAVSVLGAAWLDRGVSLPRVTPALPETVAVGTLAVAGAGILVFAVEFGYRVSRPLVERFESVNPEVDEALRTARDALDDGHNNRVVRALYADVVERLRSTSSIGLVSVPRLAVSVLLVVLLSLATIHASVAAIDLGDDVSPRPDTDGGGGVGPTGGGREPVSGELQPGDEVLGEPEDVTSGSENLSAPVSVEQGGPGDEAFEQYETDGTAGGSTAGELQRTGFAPPEDVEDADLIREYNLRIREDENG